MKSPMRQVLRKVTRKPFKPFGPFRNATKSRPPSRASSGLALALREARNRQSPMCPRSISHVFAALLTLSLAPRAVSRCGATTFLRLLIVRSEVGRLSWT